MTKTRCTSRLSATIALLVAALFSSSAYADPFEFIRIGDQDGFGYGGAPGAIGADGNPANRNGTPILDQQDLLPDINQDGIVATGSVDDFDNRNNEGNTCVGCTVNAGTTGSQFTDIALSTSYDFFSAFSNVDFPDGLVFDANTGVFGSGGAFPMPPSDVLTNQPGFVFDFSVALGDIDPAATIFFNLIFGDYDVFPASIIFEFADGSTITDVLTLQPPTEDGLIQSAFAELLFGDVFALNAAGDTWIGSLIVDFDAPNEPYTAFDFVELSTTPISVDAPESVPEPSTLLLMGLGLVLLAVKRTRRRPYEN